MFDRCYALRSFPFVARPLMDEQINQAVRDYRHPHAEANIVCMTTDTHGIYVLIEYWKERVSDHGDSQQDPSGTMDPAPAVGQSGRKGPRRANHSGSTQRHQSKGVGVAVESNGEVDVPLPYDLKDDPGGVIPEPPLDWP